MWPVSSNGDFRPAVRNVWGYFTHPFPSTDGNRRSFVQVVDVKRIPQNGVAPFRMEKMDLVQVDFSQMSQEALVTFLGMGVNIIDRIRTIYL